MLNQHFQIGSKKFSDNAIRGTLFSKALHSKFQNTTLVNMCAIIIDYILEFVGAAGPYPGFHRGGAKYSKSGLFGGQYFSYIITFDSIKLPEMGGAAPLPPFKYIPGIGSIKTVMLINIGMKTMKLNSEGSNRGLRESI